ncbi:glycosyltransferase [Candidatus Parcubacteria bacterium]|nr:glycosyltransferase [Candidatus Parcubacteria bacterium]
MPSVTVLIPAYNEEANIAFALMDITGQNENDFKLDKIIVISDGSTDNTVKEAKSVNDTRISIRDYKDRKGKKIRTSEAYRDIETDIIVQMDADGMLSNAYVLEQLIKPFLKDSTITLVCSRAVAHRPTTFVGNASFIGYKIWDDIRNSLKENGIRYRCEGKLYALKTSAVKQLSIPADVMDDLYTFYYIISHGGNVAFASEAIVYFELPSNARDYITQMTRLLGHNIQSHIDESLLNKYETIHMYDKSRALLVSFYKQPFWTLAYLCLHIPALFFSSMYRAKSAWMPASSTKRINRSSL